MHEHRIPGLKPNFSILVTSTTRTKQTDSSGKPLKEFLENEGYKVTGYDVIMDNPELIENKVRELLELSDVLVISGGTGLSSRDFTVPAVRKISTDEMTGFSTVFSMMSYGEIGTSAIMSRATAFIVDRKPVFCLPGSPSGTRMGVEKIILPEIDHIMHELNR